MLQPENIVRCTACGMQHINPRSSLCPACGAILPLTSKPVQNGDRPPMPPRELDKKYIRKIKYTGNAFTMIGIIFTVPLFPTLIFPLIGIFLWKRGLKIANNELIPLQHGETVEGEIESIRLDYSTRMNGRSPFTVTFVFEANGMKHRGTVSNVWEDYDLRKQRGDKVWVVYMPDNPSLSSIWPPLQ